MDKSFAQFLWDTLRDRSNRDRPSQAPYTWEQAAAICGVHPNTLSTWRSLTVDRRPSRMSQYISLEKFFGPGVWWYAADGDADLATLLANRNRPEIRREIESILSDAARLPAAKTYATERTAT